MTEEEIKAAFVTAFNRLVTERDEIIANARLVRQTLCDTTALTEEKGKLQQELAVLVEMTEKAVRENAALPKTKRSINGTTTASWKGTMPPRLVLTR